MGARARQVPTRGHGGCGSEMSPRPKSSQVPASRAPLGHSGKSGGQPVSRSGPRLQSLRVPRFGLCAPQSRAHSGGHCGSGATPAGPGAGAGKFCAGASCSRRDCSWVHSPPPRGSPPPSTCERHPEPALQRVTARGATPPTPSEAGPLLHASHPLRAF